MSFNTNEFLSFEEVASSIAAAGSEVTHVIEGENGIGKTALYWHLAKLPQFQDHITLDPIDCTQLSDGSVWMPDIDKDLGVSRELPNERFGVSRTNRKGVNGSRPVLIMLDEIAKAPQFIKNVLAPIVYEHRIGDYHMPEGSVVFAATNLSVEGLGDSIQAHLRNRLTFLKMRKPTASEWLQWGAVSGVDERVLAFVHQYPNVMDSFLDYEKGGKYEGRDMAKDNGMIFNPRSVQTAYASPRSLHKSSKYIRAADGKVNDNTLGNAVRGTIGPVAAETFMSFIRFGREICSFERIMKDPDTAPVTKDPTAQLVQVFQMVTRADERAEVDKVVHYVQRMREEMQSIFCNTVANSPRINTYATNSAFGTLLRKHQIFLAA